MLKKIFLRFWDSPTLMTWMSYSTKALSLFIVLPLILKKFTAPEISLWYLFSSIITFTGLIDLGFKATFSRIISFAVGGADDIGIQTGLDIKYKKEINWHLIEKINSNMNLIYGFLSFLMLLIFLSLGTLALRKPIQLTADHHQMWMAWGIVIVTSVIQFYGTIYQNYLVGLNKIALVKRIESVTNLGSIFTAIITLLMGGNILHLAIAIQIWVVLNVLRDWYLCRIIEGGRFKHFKSQPFDKVFFMKIWRPAWRGGLSGLMSNGLTQLSGILYAQIGAVEIVAGYLLALKIITQIKQISQAPFYSKIPLMTILRVEGNIKELKKVAQKGMFIGHMVFVIAVILVSLFSNYLMQLIHSNVPFVSNNFWLLLSFAFLIHRYGAMHMQLYLTTNHVISHIADGISGILFIIFGFLLINKIGIYAIPIGMLAGYLGFYAWYAAYFSLKSVKVGFLDFEKKTVIIPLSVFIIYSIFVFNQ